MVEQAREKGCTERMWMKGAIVERELGNKERERALETRPIQVSDAKIVVAGPLRGVNQCTGRVWPEARCTRGNTQWVSRRRYTAPLAWRHPTGGSSSFPERIAGIRCHGRCGSCWARGRRASATWRLRAPRSRWACASAQAACRCGLQPSPRRRRRATCTPSTHTEQAMSRRKEALSPRSHALTSD